MNIVSLIAARREEARLPLRTIQWYLDTVPGLRLSLGAIVDATQQGARKAQAKPAAILERIRSSPVVHADETGWREDGHNGYVWAFSTPARRYFLRRGRSKAVVDEVLGSEFAGAPVSDCYAACITTTAPSNAAGRICCGTSTTSGPSTPTMTGCAGGLAPSTNLSEQRRLAIQPALERRLLALCQPCLDDPSAVQAGLCRRIDRHIKSLPRTRCGELFVFVAEPEAPRTITPPSAAGGRW